MGWIRDCGTQSSRLEWVAFIQDQPPWSLETLALLERLGSTRTAPYPFASSLVSLDSSIGHEPNPTDLRVRLGTWQSLPSQLECQPSYAVIS